MNPEEHLGSGSDVGKGPGEAAPKASLLTLVFTDLAGSTALKERLGDRAGVALVQEHHAVLRKLLAGFPEAQEISTAGDSFLLAFSKPSDGVRFALLLQSALVQFNRGREVCVQDRVGLHLGEVLIEERLGRRDVHGMQVDACARVMGLAQPGQILLTRPVFDNARQSLKGEEIGGIPGLAWLNHGRFELKGIAEPMEICEVRSGIGVNLVPPITSEKARRVESAEGEAVLGWRPAVGQGVPNTQWVLEQKLGEGGFGEVWLGRHQAMKERRVFKFCFRADRVRSLKREMTLFRLIKERIGDHPNIVSLREVYFDKPPFYVEEDYVAGSDLANWCAAQGGPEKVPLETKLEIVAQVADALQAAHDAGVIHRDVKPGNILVSGGSSTLHPQTSTTALARLTDFGIGQVVSEEVLAGVTRAGFTQTLAGSDSSSQTGTHLYMAPELLAGKPASTRSDTYSLGVVLYQLVIGDFKRPLTTDWAKGVADPLLREDLRQCFAGDPEERFAGVGQLARNLRARDWRQAELARRDAEQAERERMRRQTERRRKLLLASGIATLALVAVAMALLYGLRRARQEARVARLNAYAADMKAAQGALQRNNLGLALQLLNAHRPKGRTEDLRGMEWRYLWQAARGDELHTWTQTNMVTGVRLSPDGAVAVSSGLDGFLRVWDVAGRKPQPVAVIERGVRDDDALVSFCFSPDGRTLASAHREGAIILLDPKTWQPVRKLPLPAEDKDRLMAHTCMDYSPDGRWLAVKMGPQVKIWDTRTYESRSLQTDAIWRIAFAPDSSVLGVCGYDAITLWDAATGTKTQELRGLPGAASQVALSPQGKYVAAGNWDGQIHLWDLRTGQTIWTNTAHVSRVNGLRFSKDGAWLVTAGYDQLMHIWQVGTWQKVRTLRGHMNEIWSLDFSSDDRFLLTSSKDGTVKLWDPRREPPPTRWRLQPDEVFFDFALEGPRFLTLTTNWLTLRHWEGRRLVKTVELEDTGCLETLGSVFCPGPGNVLTAGTNSTIFVLSTETGRIIRRLKLADRLGRLAGASPDGSWLAGERGSGLWVWDCQSGQLVARFPEWAWPHAVAAFSPDGRLLAAGTTNHCFKVWDLRSRRQLYTLGGHRWHALSLAFSADSRLLATGSWDGEARIWDLRTGKQIAGPFRGHGSGVDAVCFSADGRTLVTSGSDLSVRLWHVATGREMLILDHANRVPTLRLLSPAGRLLCFRDTVSNTLCLESIPSLAEIDASQQ